MAEKANNPVIKILLKVISVILALVFAGSALGAVAVSGVRSFFGNGKFEGMVNELELSEVKFTAGGKSYTASDYIYEIVAEVMPSSIKNYGGALSSIFGTSVNSAIKKLISSEELDTIVKTTMMDCVDYYLNSDVKEAKKHLKEEKVVVDPAKAYENVESLSEAIRVYVRSFVINTVENTAGVSSDKIIILLSKSTKNLLTLTAVISAILLVLCNLSTVFDLLLYFGGASAVFGVVIKVLQGKFESSQTDKTLIGYQMLKPLVDGFSPNATAGIVMGVILILAFAGLVLSYKSKGKAENE